MISPQAATERPMMHEDLKRSVWQANLDLLDEGLVFQTWGNASGIDRRAGVAVIKPSGVPYGDLRPENMVAVSLETGRCVAEGALRPSSDTPTHLELYRAMPGIGGVVHTHSLYATAWAQAEMEIPPLGTTHADYIRGPVPCTRALTRKEIETDYETNIGKVIVERLAGCDPIEAPCILVAWHGPFTWGRTPQEAVANAVVLERVARLASETLRINPDATPITRDLLDKHFLRKHGPDASYGQEPRRKNG